MCGRCPCGQKAALFDTASSNRSRLQIRADLPIPPQGSGLYLRSLALLGAEANGLIARNRDFTSPAELARGLKEKESNTDG